MAKQNLYGIGKGQAQVFDTMPLVNLAAQERDYNRKRNAQDAAKKATAAANLNEQFGKLKNTSWDRDQKYIGDLIKDTESWMMDQYSEGGESAIINNPEKKREFQERINFIKTQNDASHAQISMGDKMLVRATENMDNIDEESSEQFNAWLELPSEQRLVTPMPMIRDRELNLGEIVGRDLKTEIAGLVTPVGYSGTPDEEGRYNNFEGKTINQEELDNMVSTIAINPNSNIYKTAKKEVLSEINTDLVPETIMENGIEVKNPMHDTVVDKRMKIKIRETIEGKLPPTYMKSSARYAPGSGDKTEVEVTEVTEDAEKTVTFEKTPGGTKESPLYEEVYTDKSGKEYGKLKVQMYDYKGTLYEKYKLPKGKTIDDDDVLSVGIGTVVDNDGNTRKEGVKGLKPIRIKEPTKVSRKTTVTTTSKPKEIVVKTIIKEDGTEETGKDKTIKGVLAGHYERDGKVVAQMSTKEGLVETPMTDAIKKAFPEEWKEIQKKGKEVRGKALSGEEAENQYGI